MSRFGGRNRLIPAKNRERKCSTCKHYQASPLWRKGWCRNPLLYDRNTNHLVEADSLACNRTFIDYWEPITEGAGPAGSSTRDRRPRVAPSIPMQPVDAKGRPLDLDEDYLGEPSPYQTGELKHVKETPVSGLRAAPLPLFRPATQRPPLALVDDDYDELLGDSRETGELSSVDRGDAGIDKTRPSPAVRESARDRIARGRRSRMPQIELPRLTGIPLYAAVGVLAVLIVVLAAFFIFPRSGPNQTPNPAGQPTSVSQPLPTPTGFGDPTPTGASGTQATTVPIIVDTIAVGGYVSVTGTGDGLIVRSSPSRAGARMAKLADGTKARVVDGPRESDGFTWWKLDSFDKNNTSLSGWSVADYLKATAPRSEE